MRLSEALAELQGPRRKGLYLYDLSLPLKLPGLLEHVKLPRFFSHCYLQQTMRRGCMWTSGTATSGCTLSPVASVGAYGIPRMLTC